MNYKVLSARWHNIAAICLLSLNAHCFAANDSPPSPFGSVPSAAQIAWEKAELIAFTHFNVNTFTGNEWGLGNESPNVFNPTALDCNQWVRVLKAAGFKEIVLTAKHHDGFCLWPSAYTEHCVKSSSWESGKGDVVKEFSAACASQGVRCGLYLSPWDRNSAYYGDSPRYNQYYVNQLTELLTHYGDIKEVWFDGACGEGPNGKQQQYDWPTYFATVAKLAPNAVEFNGSPTDGHGVRFAGNEAGYATKTLWDHDGNDPNGVGWYPAECDVSIRPGWYYHPDQDEHLKSVDALLNIYLGSVGRGAVMMLNVPPDRRGLISDSDIARLNEFHEALDQIFANNLAIGKTVSASNVRGNSAKFAADNLTSTDYDKYWATDDNVNTGSFTVNLEKPTIFNYVMLQEYIPLGQRVSSFTVEALVGNSWTQIAKGTTIGYKRILWVPRVTATKVRVNITSALADPVITKFGLYNGPKDAPITPVSLIAQKAATASDVHGNQTEFGADKAVDGDSETRWATDDGTSECWLQADAGEPVQIGKLYISEFAPRIQQFRLEYKVQDGDDWKVAMAGTTVGDNYIQSFPPVTARFVRLHILKASDAPSIWEFQVYGPDKSTSAGPYSLIELKPSTASDFHSGDPQFGPDKAVDGNMDTRWATDDGTSECWLESDVGTTVTMSSFTIKEWDPRIQKFQIEYKLAESDAWKVAYAGSTAGTDFSATFAPVQARFIRLHILSASSAPTISEFEAFATR